MGDRTSLTLSLHGKATRAQLKQLTKLIREWEGESDFGDAELGVFGWHQCYAGVERETEEAIRIAGLGYALAWDGHSGAYGPGVEINRPDGTFSEWSATDDGSAILLTVAEASDPEKLANAVRDQAYLESPLEIVEQEAA